MAKHDLSLRSLYGDGWSVPPMRQKDFQILSAVSQLGGGGTAAEIADAVEKCAPGFNVGYLYAALDRLRKKELVTARRGYDREWKYQVTEYGERTIRRAVIEGKRIVKAGAGLDAGECAERSE
jgi:DNA-binding PadR family transcriptional regulator